MREKSRQGSYLLDGLTVKYMALLISVCQKSKVLLPVPF